MRKCYWSFILAGTIALGSLSVACGDDDDNANPTDGGNREGSINPEGGPNPEGGGPDGGCTFASYVIGLVNTQTTAAALPDTTLGAGCKESTDQAEFKALFP